ncbi:endonuclease/exonuclease/phosphatase family protein [Streptomyces sp. NPDC046977]|uniref:endonuclease/exonuclease/phosphatase family protein n=1 Tax=Streptomyces sp. NPDC046977 TaxID=3154703 RepID=UPI0033CEF005
MPIARPSRSRSRTAAFALISTGIATSVALTGLPAAHAAPSSSAVVAEVYGGGGNSGATLTNDFVELANAGTAPYNLSGYSVQYLPGSPSASSKWGVTPLTGSIAPGGRFLVTEAAGTGGTTALPAADASGNIAMSGTTGTIALVSGTTPLTCLTAADCAADTRIVDVVGYGTATVREGSPVAGASNTASVSRASSLADTDNNAADLTAGNPSPVNSAGQTPGGPGGDPGDPGDGGPTQPGTTRIHDIQGTTRVSPLKNQTVTGVPGIVTGVRTTGSKGYWIQDPDVDADPRTSEAVFVYTGSANPTVAVGDKVLVTGKVSEYYPGTGTQSLTEITGPNATVLSSGNTLPAAVRLDQTAVPDTYGPDAAGGSIENLPLQPNAYALDFYEAHEGELARFTGGRVVGGTNEYGEVWLTLKPNENPSERGGTVYGSYAQPNTGRIKVMSLNSGAPVPAANVGDKFTGDTAGPIDYDSFGGYNVQATTVGSRVDMGLKREVTRKQKDAELAVATYNVENLDPSDPADKFARLAEGVVTNLSSPDIVALEEIQDNNGAVDDGTVAADRTVSKFIDAIVAAGGPRYDWRSVDPTNDTDGGEPGGNIRQVFLFNPDRVVFKDRPGGDAGTAVAPVATKKGVRLSVSPGRIDPAGSAWGSSRKPLVGEFEFNDKQVIVVANHFNSKGGDEPLHAKNQQPNRSSEAQRKQQATEVNTFVKSLLDVDKNARVVVLGDLNDYEFSDALSTLTSGGVLTDLLTTLPAEQRYTYVYEGNSQSLDHILLSPDLRRYDYDVVHINAEFADQASDHDPQIVRMRLSGAQADD